MQSELAPSPVHAFDISPDGAAVPAAELTAKVPADAGYRWLHFDLADPGLAEWCAAQLPPLANRVLLAAKTRPRADEHEHGLFLTLRGINLNEGSELADMVSLRLWVTADLVVSVRRVRIFAMEDMHRDIIAGNAPPTPARMIARITENLVERIETVSIDLEDRTDQMEEAVYEGGAAALPDLFPLNRSVIKLRRHIGPLADALNTLSRTHSTLIPATMRNRMRDTANRATRSVEEMEEVRERLRALSSHLDMANEARVVRNGYRLSVIAAIFLPMGFLTGLFGVNVAGMPGTDTPYAFAVLSGAMAILGVVSYLVLRWIKWF